MDHFKTLDRYIKEGKIPPDIGSILHDFFLSYAQAVHENGYTPDYIHKILNTFLRLVAEQLLDPFRFEIYHEPILKPFDYYHFGLELFRPLVLFSESKLVGQESLEEISGYLDQGENVILFGNHQTEPDAQAIILLLEKSYPKLAKSMIFVAGHRVTSDPLAVPFSMGINLLCVYSKRHIETDLALKEEKLLHNQRTMKKMLELLDQGGKCIYIAPSGGRDRPDSLGRLSVAPFDQQSIEMCWLISKKANKKSHFFPLSLSTYQLLPPPSVVQKELGEQRRTHSTPIHLAFGSEIDMEGFPGAGEGEKKLQKQKRADYIWNLVVNNYEKL